MDEKMEWISVEDGLPEMLYDADGGVNMVLVYKKDGFECSGHIQVWNTVWINKHPEAFTHWMPLPDPPETDAAIDDAFTLTITATEPTTIHIYAAALQMYACLGDMSEHLRSLEKYQSDRLAGMTGMDLIRELRDDFREMLPNIARG